jgi:hypothetical protein
MGDFACFTRWPRVAYPESAGDYFNEIFFIFCRMSKGNCFWPKHEPVETLKIDLHNVRCSG